MSDKSNSIEFKYGDANELDLNINFLINDATRTLKKGDVFEIRRKALPSEFDEYLKAISDFTLAEYRKKLTSEKLADNFGIAWVSNDDMKDLRTFNIEMSNAYNPKKNYSVIGRFKC